MIVYHLLHLLFLKILESKGDFQIYFFVDQQLFHLIPQLPATKMAIYQFESGKICYQFDELGRIGIL